MSLFRTPWLTKCLGQVSRQLPFYVRRILDKLVIKSLFPTPKTLSFADVHTKVKVDNKRFAARLCNL